MPCLVVVEDDLTASRKVHQADAQEVAPLHAAAGHVICCQPPLPTVLNHLQAASMR